MKVKIYCSIFAMITTLLGYGQSITKNPPVIPQPVAMHVHDGYFQMDKKAVICYKSEESEDVARFYADFLHRHTGRSIPVVYAKRSQRNAICFGIDERSRNLSSIIKTPIFDWN